MTQQDNSSPHTYTEVAIGIDATGVRTEFGILGTDHMPIGHGVTGA
ncbi:hypothetical protein ACXDF8_18805 [Mycolicibacterium sp. CBM1]